MPKPDPDFEPDYDTPDVGYDDVTQASHDDGTGPDNDAAQPDYGSDFADPADPEASQEYYKRSQK